MSQWISITDRLPLVGEDVVAHIADSPADGTAWVREFATFRPSGFYTREGQVNATHWMELPPPPKQ